MVDRDKQSDQPVEVKICPFMTKVTLCPEEKPTMLAQANGAQGIGATVTIGQKVMQVACARERCALWAEYPQRCQMSDEPSVLFPEVSQYLDIDSPVVLQLTAIKTGINAIYSALTDMVDIAKTDSQNGNEYRDHMRALAARTEQTMKVATESMSRQTVVVVGEESPDETPPGFKC